MPRQNLTSFYRGEIGDTSWGYMPRSYLRTNRRTGACTARDHRGEVPMSDFAHQLEAEIPRLRRYARALTRDVSRADDLVQSCLTRAVAKQHLWQPGTD